MRKFSCALAFMGLMLGLTATAGDAKLEPGFRLLFNGKNFDGWQPKGKKDPLDGKTEAFKGRFKIDNGAIVVNPAVKGDAYIETAKVFSGDAHIKFDFNPGKDCNNDIFFRGSKFDIVLKLKGVKENEWNSCEIITTGDKIEHKINGETARKSDAKSKSSPFVLRAEFGTIQIKNIRIKTES